MNNDLLVVFYIMTLRRLSLTHYGYDMTTGWILAEDRNEVANGEDLMADEVEKPDRMDEGRWYGYIDGYEK